MTEQALRDTMVMLGASLFQRGYATGGAGNLSALLPDGTLIATMELPDPDCPVEIRPGAGGRQRNDFQTERSYPAYRVKAG